MNSPLKKTGFASAVICGIQRALLHFGAVASSHANDLPDADHWQSQCHTQTPSVEKRFTALPVGAEMWSHCAVRIYPPRVTPRLALLAAVWKHSLTPF